MAKAKKDTGIGFCESNKWALENSSHNWVFVSDGFHFQV
jgi:hypothetical protein